VFIKICKIIWALISGFYIKILQKTNILYVYLVKGYVIFRLFRTQDMDIYRHIEAFFWL
jgi:hypothetical protein